MSIPSGSPVAKRAIARAAQEALPLEPQRLQVFFFKNFATGSDVGSSASCSAFFCRGRWHRSGEVVATSSFGGHGLAALARPSPGRSRSASSRFRIVELPPLASSPQRFPATLPEERECGGRVASTSARRGLPARARRDPRCSSYSLNRLAQGARRVGVGKAPGREQPRAGDDVRPGGRPPRTTATRVEDAGTGRSTRRCRRAPTPGCRPRSSVTRELPCRRARAVGRRAHIRNARRRTIAAPRAERVEFRADRTAACTARTPWWRANADLTSGRVSS